MFKDLKRKKELLLDKIRGIYLATFHSSQKNKSILFHQESPTFSYIAITAIIKNEAPYLREWLEHHLFIGVEHFFLYDNDSTDQTKKVLEPYIQRKIVTYIKCPGKTMQIPAYNDAIARFGEKTHWMGFIDVDEFIILKNDENLSKFLNLYDNYAALGINWIMYDNNGFEKKPDNGFVLSNYTRTLTTPNTTHVKTILKPCYVKYCSNPHFMFLKKGYEVDENFNKISPPFTKISSTNKIQINHYFSKSTEEYLAKIARGRVSVNAKYVIRKEAYDFSNYPTQNSSILTNKYVNHLKEHIPDTYGNNYSKLAMEE